MVFSGRTLVLSLALLASGCATQQQVASQDNLGQQPAKAQVKAKVKLEKTPAKQAGSTPKQADKARVEALSRHQMADDILMRAMALIGTPYRYGGMSPQTGFDCSGLIGYVFNDSLGMKIPRSTREMIQVNAPVIGKDKLRSGDIVFFATSGGRRVSHAGIYVGDGRFVHAPSTGGKVRMDRLDSTYWSKAYLQAKRYLPEQSPIRNL